jgi:hypothetical protein
MPRRTPPTPPSDHIGPARPIRDRIIGLRRVRAGELIPNPENWRRHPEPQRQALRAVLEQIGYADALLARQSPEGLILIDGHLRSSLDPDAEVPVLILDVSEDEARTLLAVLDPLAGMAVADERALAELLADAIIPEGALLQELARLAGGVLREGVADPEEIPGRPRTSRVKRGERWCLGPHRLACADARSGEALRALLGGERAEVLWTDPPYGVGYVGKTRESLRIEGDHLQGLAELLEASFAAADGVLAPGARLYVAHPSGPSLLSFARAFCAAGWDLRQDLVWVKDSMVLGHADYHFRHEGVFYGYKPGESRHGRGHRGWWGGNDQTTVFEVPRPRASREHPTAKPVELIDAQLRNSSLPGAIVLDPFAGSGSTLIACEQLGRRCAAVEIDPSYCEVILRRWEAFAGQAAVRDDG